MMERILKDEVKMNYNFNSIFFSQTTDWNNIYVQYVNSLSLAEFPPHKLGLKTATVVNYSLLEQETCGEI
jgi:hypothetical protein